MAYVVFIFVTSSMFLLSLSASARRYQLTLRRVVS